jgi:hypothetical protein
LLEGIENLGDSSGVTDDCEQMLAAAAEPFAGVGIVYASRSRATGERGNAGKGREKGT